MAKILFFDTETTGLNAVKNDIVQLGLIITINGDEKERRDLKCQPFSYENIDPKALDTHGFTLPEIRQFPPPQELYRTLIEMFGKYIDKYSIAEDKFYPAGFRVNFDLDFLTEFFKKNGDPWLLTWQNYRLLDPLNILYIMDMKGQIKLPNYKLKTVCNYFGIKNKAHDALSDIEATRELLYILTPFIKDGIADLEVKPKAKDKTKRAEARL